MKVAWVVRQAEGGMLVHLDQLFQGLGPDFEIVIIGSPGLQQWVGDRSFIPIPINDGLHPVNDMVVVWQLANAIAKVAPDIVHVHGLKSALLTVPAARIRRLRPLLFTAHNCLPKHRYFWQGKGQHWVTHRVLNSFDHIISVSDAVRKEIVKLVPGNRVVTIRNGVDHQRFVGQSRPVGRCLVKADSNTLVIGTVARLIKDKGIGTLLEAASLLKNLIPNVRFIIVGDGPDRARFQAYLEGLGLNDHVQLLGRREDIPQLMAGWDVFVLPTYIEAFSISVLEAMAAGLPLIVTDLPSMQEMIVPGRSGYMVKPADPLGLSTALLHVLKDMPKARIMGKFNRERVSSLFGTEKMVERTRETYRQLVAKERVR